MNLWLAVVLSRRGGNRSARNDCEAMVPRTGDSRSHLWRFPIGLLANISTKQCSTFVRDDVLRRTLFRQAYPEWITFVPPFALVTISNRLIKASGLLDSYGVLSPFKTLEPHGQLLLQPTNRVQQEPR